MAAIHDRSTATQAAFRVRWRDGRGAPERSYTFTSPRVSPGQSEAENAARRLKAHLDLMGHQLEVIQALTGAGFRVAGITVETAPEPEPVVTVGDYARRWLAALVRPNPRSRDDYAKMLDRYILPTLGSFDIAALRREHVALWLRVQEVSTTGRGPGQPPALRTVAHRHGVLSQLLNDAAVDGLRTGNPPKGLGPTPKSLHREMTFLTHSEWATLYRCLYREFVKAGDATFGGDLATLLVGTGIRWSEATALTVEQCELLTERAVIRIDRAWKRQPDGSYHVGEPKSRRAVHSQLGYLSPTQSEVASHHPSLPA